MHLLHLLHNLTQTFIQWMLSFISHCRNRAIQQIIPARHQLLQLSSTLYKEFFEKETTTCEWNDGGVYYVCNTRKGLATLAHEVNLLNKYHLPASLLSSKNYYIFFRLLEKTSYWVELFMRQMDG